MRALFLCAAIATDAPRGNTPPSASGIFMEALRSQLATRLDHGLEAMRLALPGPAQSRLLDYLELLALWNRAYNLTGVRDPLEMVARHLLDSLAMLPYVRGTSLADLGSGAGLPGIPLAIARPGLQVTLIDSNGKKTRFLREARRTLSLANVRVEQARAEDFFGAFDTVAARAFAGLADMLAAGGHLMARDGRCLALKGPMDPAELTTIPAGYEVTVVHALDVPGVAGRRCLVEIARVP
jgi:16S rRNA (guanine527-N7)-methyltransferase